MSIPPFGSAPTPDATATKKGKLKLAGDLTGTADSPALANAGAGAAGPTGSATVTPIVTVDAKGRVTALSSATTAPTNAAGGDLTGNYPSPRVAVGILGGVAWTTVTKALDESVSASTTLQADDELFFTAVNTGIYEFEFVIIYASPLSAGTPDFKFALGEDSAAIHGSWWSHGIATNDTSTNAASASSLAATASRGTAALNRATFVVGLHTGLGGTFGLQWAQNVSDANAVTVRAGSVLRYRRIL